MNAEIESSPKFAHLDKIEKYRWLPGESNCASKKYQILPDGYFDLAFLLSETRCLVVLAGPYTKKTHVPIGAFELFAIRFRLGKIPNLLDIKSSELVNTMVQLPNVFGMRSDHLCEILLNNRGFIAKQKIIEKLIHNKQFQFMTKSKVYHQATSIIENHCGQIKVHEIANILGVSIRTLERQFNEILGFAPKHFIRLVRFQKTVGKLKKVNKSKNLTDIAYESGYFDQAHFIKDFRSLSGESPLTFRK